MAWDSFKKNIMVYSPLEFALFHLIMYWNLIPTAAKLSAIFYLRPVLTFGYCYCLCVCVCMCVCVRVSINHEFVYAITHQSFKLGSLNLDQRCKRPWLRAQWFCGMIDRDFQGQIELQSQDSPHFKLVYAITHHQLKLQFPNLEWKCILALFRSSIQFLVSNPEQIELFMYIIGIL